MPPRLSENKRYYQDILHRHINENPQHFLDLDSSAEPGSAPAAAKRLPSGGGRFGPPPAKSERDAEAERAFRAGFYDGLTFGLGDELEAGWTSLGAMFDERDMGDVYDAELARARAEAEQLEQVHPIAYGGGTIIGSLVNPLTYVPGGMFLQGARAATQAGKVAKVARTAMNLAKVGAVEGAFHGFNSGEGGLRNRLVNARDEAVVGALAGAVVPVGAHVAGQTAKRAAGVALDLPTRRVIGRVTQRPEEAAALLEKARLLRRTDVNHPDASWPELASTARDLAFERGSRLNDEMTVLHKGLYGQGLQTSDVALTKARMDRVGAAYVGPGYKTKRGGRHLLTMDEAKRYRGPATKEWVFGTGRPGVQANLERDRIKRDKYHHNLHINISDIAPTPRTRR